MCVCVCVYKTQSLKFYKLFFLLLFFSTVLDVNKSGTSQRMFRTSLFMFPMAHKIVTFIKLSALNVELIELILSFFILVAGILIDSILRSF